VGCGRPHVSIMRTHKGCGQAAQPRADGARAPPKAGPAASDSRARRGCCCWAVAVAVVGRRRKRLAFKELNGHHVNVLGHACACKRCPKHLLPACRGKPALPSPISYKGMARRCALRVGGVVQRGSRPARTNAVVRCSGCGARGAAAVALRAAPPRTGGEGKVWRGSGGSGAPGLTPAGAMKRVCGVKHDRQCRLGGPGLS
jgi:hypothetical protein